MTSQSRGARLLIAVAAVTIALAGCGGDDEDVAGFCDQFRSFEDSADALFEGIFGSAEDGDIDQAKEAFGEAAEQISDLADDAPDDISDDVDTVRTAFSETNEQVQEAETLEDLEGIDQSALDSDEVDEAGQRVDDWTQDNCDADGGE